MDHEPVIITVGMAVIITVIGNLVIDLLTDGMPVKIAVIKTVTTIILMAGGTTAARNNAWSPASVEKVTKNARK